MNLTPTPVKPLQISHIDSISLEKNRFLSTVDGISRDMQVFQVGGAHAAEGADKLLDYFTNYSVLEVNVSDKLTEFNNKIIKEIMKAHVKIIL